MSLEISSLLFILMKLRISFTLQFPELIKSEACSLHYFFFQEGGDFQVSNQVIQCLLEKGNGKGAGVCCIKQLKTPPFLLSLPFL